MTARVFKLNEIEYGLHGFGNLVDQLSLLEHLKLPVAECFVIGPDIFEEFLKLHNAHGEFGKVRVEHNLLNPEASKESRDKLESKLSKLNFSHDWALAIIKAYNKLGAEQVWVRVSDLKSGGLDYTKDLDGFVVSGDANLLELVRRLLFKVCVEKARGGTGGSIKAGLVISAFNPALVSGRVVSVDPADKTRNLVESVWGEAADWDKSTRDLVVVDKVNRQIVANLSKSKECRWVFENKKLVKKKFGKSDGRRSSVDEDIALELSRAAVRVQSSLLKAQVLSWRLTKVGVEIVGFESFEVGRAKSVPRLLAGNKIVASGVGLGGGRVTAEIGGKGGAWVDQNIGSRSKSKLAEAAAVLLADGSVSDQALMELASSGVPVVVDLGSDAKKLASGTVITVDGDSGLVYEGVASASKQIGIQETRASKLMARFSGSESLEKLAQLPHDGVMFDFEDVVRELKVHPEKLSSHARSRLEEDWSRKLEEAMSVSRNLPLFVAFSHLRDDQLAEIESRKAERNPKLGRRGGHRIGASDELFLREIGALKRSKHGLDNPINVVVPSVHSARQLRAIKHLLGENNLLKTSYRGFYLELSTPANLLNFHKFEELGVDGFVVNIDRLVELVTGIDIEHEELKFELMNAKEELGNCLSWIGSNLTRLKKPVVVSLREKGLMAEALPVLVGAGVTRFVVGEGDLSATHYQLVSCEHENVKA